MKTSQPAKPSDTLENEHRSDSAQIADRYQAGESALSLTNYYGISRRQVYNALAEQGVPLRPWPVIAPAPPGLAAAYLGGECIREVADRFGLTYRQARRMLITAGVKLRPQGGS